MWNELPIQLRGWELSYVGVLILGFPLTSKVSEMLLQVVEQNYNFYLVECQRERRIGLTTTTGNFRISWDCFWEWCVRLLVIAYLTHLAPFLFFFFCDYIYMNSATIKTKRNCILLTFVSRERSISWTIEWRFHSTEVVLVDHRWGY